MLPLPTGMTAFKRSRLGLTKSRGSGSSSGSFYMMGVVADEVLKACGTCTFTTIVFLRPAPPRAEVTLSKGCSLSPVKVGITDSDALFCIFLE